MLFLIAFLLLLTLTAVFVSWLEYPLSESLNAYQLDWSWQAYFPTSVGISLQLLMLFACVFLVYRKFFIALVLVCIALAQLLFLPWHILLTHPDWLVNYLIESQERQQLNYFTGEYFIPNINAEPTYIPTLQFETLLDQVRIVFSMLSIGWYISVLSSIAILMILLKHWQHSFQLPITLILITGSALLTNYAPTLSLLQAAQAQHHGNQQLANDHTHEALQNYQRALKLNPVLNYSTPFLIKVADAYAALLHEYHPANNISKAWIIIQQYKLFNGYNAPASRYRQARTLLQKADNNYLPVTLLEKSLVKFSKRLINQLWASEGLSEYKHGHLHKALQAFQQLSIDQLATRFFLATLYIKLNTPQQALELLRPYAHKIDHPSIKADIYCTIGDAYTRAKDWLQARKAYLLCTKLDNTKNYRVTRALSGF